MNKKNNNKGFTLAELLIVVAIIAVLVAIAIPVFTQQLEKSREATDLANIRSAYAELVTSYLDNGEQKTATVPVTQRIADWQSGETSTNKKNAYVGTAINVKSGSGAGASSADSATRISVPAHTSGNYTLTIDASGVVHCA